MKTAMQEIIEAWYSPDKIDNFDAWLGNNETRLLEKEKEQIINAYYGLPIDNDALLPKDNKAELYYNQTYNQNK